MFFFFFFFSMFSITTTTTKGILNHRLPHMMPVCYVSSRYFQIIVWCFSWHHLTLELILNHLGNSFWLDPTSPGWRRKTRMFFKSYQGRPGRRRGGIWRTSGHLAPKTLQSRPHESRLVSHLAGGIWCLNIFFLEIWCCFRMANSTYCITIRHQETHMFLFSTFFLETHPAGELCRQSSVLLDREQYQSGAIVAMYAWSQASETPNFGDQKADRTFLLVFPGLKDASESISVNRSLWTEPNAAACFDLLTVACQIVCGAGY